MIPLLSKDGRIVNLSSVSSTLKPYHEQIRQRFRDPNMTLEDLEQLVQEFEVRSHSATSLMLYSGLSFTVRSSSQQQQIPKQQPVL
jgi:hypothetical protein